MKVSIQQQHNNMSTFQRNGINENKSSMDKLKSLLAAEKP
jgi:hypothetical protein